MKFCEDTSRFEGASTVLQVLGGELVRDDAHVFAMCLEEVPPPTFIIPIIPRFNMEFVFSTRVFVIHPHDRVLPPRAGVHLDGAHAHLRRRLKLDVQPKIRNELRRMLCEDLVLRHQAQHPIEVDRKGIPLSRG